MGSVTDECNCPQCNYPHANRVFYYRAGEETIFCPFCGYTYKKTRAGKGYKEQENHGHGAFIVGIPADGGKQILQMGAFTKSPTRANAERWMQAAEKTGATVLILTIVEDDQIVFLRGSKAELNKYCSGDGAPTE